MIRDTKDPDMVERLVIAFDKIAPAWTSVADLEGYAKAALETSHHAELVAALKTARKQVVAAILSPQMSVEAAEVAVALIDATLRKIGGGQ